MNSDDVNKNKKRTP